MYYFELFLLRIFRDWLDDAVTTTSGSTDIFDVIFVAVVNISFWPTVLVPFILAHWTGLGFLARGKTSRGVARAMGLPILASRRKSSVGHILERKEDDELMMNRCLQQRSSDRRQCHHGYSTSHESPGASDHKRSSHHKYSGHPEVTPDRKKPRRSHSGAGACDQIEVFNQRRGGGPGGPGGPGGAGGARMHRDSASRCQSTHHNEVQVVTSSQAGHRKDSRHLRTTNDNATNGGEWQQEQEHHHNNDSNSSAFRQQQQHHHHHHHHQQQQQQQLVVHPGEQRRQSYCPGYHKAHTHHSSHEPQYRRSSSGGGGRL